MNTRKKLAKLVTLILCVAIVIAIGLFLNRPHSCEEFLELRIEGLRLYEVNLFPSEQERTR